MSKSCAGPPEKRGSSRDRFRHASLRFPAEAGVEYVLVEGAAATAQGSATQCLSLERLIQVKRAAGRPRDLEAVAELEAILEERQTRNDS